MMKEKIVFELKPEHITLMKNLCFRTVIHTEYGDRFIPEINRKRPFGNSGAAYSAAEYLSCERDAEGKFSPETLGRIEELILELPVALEIVMDNQTFIPGKYEVSPYGAYCQYHALRKYHALKEPLNEMAQWVKQQAADYQGQLASLHEICMNIHGDDPWRVIEDLKFFSSTPFLEQAVTVFKRAAEGLEGTVDGNR